MSDRPSLNRPSRRRFMYGLATVAGATFAGPYLLKAAEPNKEKLRIAFVGANGRGGAHLHLVSQGNELPRGGRRRRNQQQNATEEQPQTQTPTQPAQLAAPSIARGHICPAFTEVDEKRWDRIKPIAPSAKGYTDYRAMFDRHMKEIDAVVVAIPDHSHACATAIALREGKHCYTEKPLTWSVAEARALTELAASKKVATQMGNHGHANEGTRLTVEWIRAGLIGDVVEVHTWTNRPVWPQGIERRPPPMAIPEGMDWDAWIGPAKMREFHDSLHPFKWRGWYDFGCGAIGDMGCHTWDCVFWAMAPDYPESVELVKIVGRTKETFPKQSIIRWDYPAKGNRPAFKAFWYDGELKPPAPEEWALDPLLVDKDAQGKPKPRPMPRTGNLFIGTKGKLLVQGDYAESPRLIPESVMKAKKRPDKTIPRSPGHKEEWIMACTGEKPWDFPGSNFANYAGPLTENMLLGAIVVRMGEVGGRIECDPIKRTIKTKEAHQYVSREYRKGWPAVAPTSLIS